MLLSILVVVSACTSQPATPNTEIIEIYTIEIDSNGNEYQVLVSVDTVYLDDFIPK